MRHVIKHTPSTNYTHHIQQYEAAEAPLDREGNHWKKYNASALVFTYIYIYICMRLIEHTGIYVTLAVLEASCMHTKQKPHKSHHLRQGWNGERAGHVLQE